MESATGTILLVQESRFRILTEDGRGLAFVLSASAPIEPQDLAPVSGRRVRIAWRNIPGLLAGEVRDLVLLGAPDRKG
jgi:hypothetical protein